VDIALDMTAFDQAKSGRITGPIWLRHKDIEFPERGWNDFPVIVLSWWLRNVTHLADGTTALCHFMDGPFEFNVSKVGSGLCQVQLVEQRAHTSKLLSEFMADESEFITALRTAAGTVLSECSRRGWTGQDIERLRESAHAGRS